MVILAEQPAPQAVTRKDCEHRARFGKPGNFRTAAAIANAVYHATGKRVRRLPIRIENLLSA
jgi:hypothetical protein